MGSRTPLKSVSDGEAWSPKTEGDREAIREQLGRLLASSVFARSKGCSSLLAYVVDKTLDGSVQDLKERTLGSEVFGCPPDYDTSTDHVVRSTAADVRKRLAQYYMEPVHFGEIRIDIPLGSYVPRFFRSVATAVPHEGSPAPVPISEGIPGVQPAARRRRYRWLAILIALAAVIFSILAVSSTRLRSSRALDGFWRPILRSPNPILVCISPLQGLQPELPGTEGRVDRESSLGVVRGSGRVFLDDAIALSRLAGLLQGSGKGYRILPASGVTFADLQSSPVILIGFNNYWTTSLADKLRFTMERNPGSDVAVLRDKKNPARNDWSVDLRTPYDRPMKDYALVVRALDPKTGQITVTAAGLTHFGTLAAADFLTNSAQIEQLGAFAPKDWENQNVAIVLSADVIKGSPGAAKIVAADFWPR